MSKKRTVKELTEPEIRILLREKLKANHQKRLELFLQTGSVVNLVRDVEPGKISPHFQEIIDNEPVSKKRYRSRGGIQVASHFLGFLEIGAVASIVFLLWLSWSGLTNLNQRAAAAWVFPTFTPTPLIRAIVLPDGHTPPDEFGGTRLKDEEIPAHLKPIAQVYANIPTPTPAPQHGIRIQITALNIDAPIVQGDGWEQLMKGVAQHIGTANPGEKGNMVLSGHNDVYGEVFRYLDRLKPGDPIIVFTYARSFTYVVDGWKVVNPAQVEVMDPTPNETLTLISCYPYLVDTQRIVVKATLLKK